MRSITCITSICCFYLNVKHESRDLSFSFSHFLIDTSWILYHSLIFPKQHVNSTLHGNLWTAWQYHLVHPVVLHRVTSSILHDNQSAFLVSSKPPGVNRNSSPGGVQGSDVISWSPHLWFHCLELHGMQEFLLTKGEMCRHSSTFISTKPPLCDWTRTFIALQGKCQFVSWMIVSLLPYLSYGFMHRPTSVVISKYYTLPQKKRNFSRSSIPVAHGSGSVTQGHWPRGFRIKYFQKVAKHLKKSVSRDFPFT